MRAFSSLELLPEMAPDSNGTMAINRVAQLAHVVIAFAGIYLIWGSTFLAIRLAIQTIPPGIMAGLRSIIAGTLYYGLLRWCGAPRPTKRDWWVALVGGVGIIAAGNGSLTYAERFIPSGTAAIIVATMPAMMTLMGWFAGISGRPRLPVWIGIILATIGVAIVVHPAALSASREQLSSVAILFAGEVVWAATSLYAGRVRQNSPPFLMASMQMLCGGGLMMAVGVTRGELAQAHPHAITTSSILAMVYLILIGSIVGYTAYLWLLRNVEPARVATFAYVNPIVAVFLGWLVADETLAPELLGGSALVIVGIALIVGFPSTRGIAKPPRLTSTEPIITG
jgi:drug/metabolite transporter (DMT)-like permease